MTLYSAFNILGISPTKDISRIQHAFAQKSHTAHPEANPDLWADLSAAYQLAIDYAKSPSHSYNAFDIDLISQDASNSSKLSDREDTSASGEYDDLFEELDASEKEHQTAQGEQELLASIDSVQQIRIDSHSHWEKKLLKIHRNNFEAILEIGLDQVQDNTVEQFFNSLKFCPLLATPTPGFSKKMHKLLEKYRNSFKDAAWGVAFDKVISYYPAGNRINYATLKLLLFFAAFMLLISIFALLTPEMIDTQVGVVEYPKWSPENINGDRVSLTVSKAVPSGKGYIVNLEPGISTNIQAGIISTYDFFDFIEAETEDGNPVTLAYTCQETYQGLFPNGFEDESYSQDLNNLLSSVQLGLFTLAGEVRVLDFGDNHLRCIDSRFPLIPENIDASFALNKLYPSGTVVVVPEICVPDMPAQGSPITEQVSQQSINWIALAPCILFSAGFVFLFLILKGKFPQIFVPQQKKNRK